MNENERSAMLAIGATALLIMAIIFVSVYFLAKNRCISRWDDSYYTLQTKCMVKTNGGAYIPESNIRVIKWVEE